MEVFQQPSTNHNNIGRLTGCCEDHRKNWASYEEVKDWRFCHGFQNCEESWIRRWLSIEKPQSFCLIRSCRNINCSNIFAKIDIPLPLEFVDQLLIPDLLPWLRQIACNHRGIIQTRYEYHGGFLDYFSWTDARVSRIELSLWKMMSSIIFSPEHPQNDEWSELLGKHRYCQKRWFKNGDELSITLLWNVAFLFCGHISSLNETCLFFGFLLFWNQEMLLSKGILTKYFDQTPTCKVNVSQS